MTANKAAIFARVSTLDQTVSNQLPELRDLAAHRDMDVTAEITVEASAWVSGTKATAFDTARAQLLEGARLGKYGTILLWSLDRLSRRGAEDMLAFTRQLAETGVRLVSVQDPWVESLADPMVREMLLAVFATVAKFESVRRSERVRAGLQRRRDQGLPVGRAKGARDRTPRRRAGYVAYWESPDGKKRKAG